MRSEFQKWYRDKYQVTKQLYFFEDTQRYEDGFAQDAWEVWQHQQSKVDELQKRVDAVNGLIEDLNKCYQQDHQNKFEYWRGFAGSAGILGKRLEQALKGGEE